MHNFTSTNLLLHAKEFAYPPIQPLYKENENDIVFEEESSFFQEYSQEFAELVTGPSDRCMNSVLFSLSLMMEIE